MKPGRNCTGKASPYLRATVRLDGLMLGQNYVSVGRRNVLVVEARVTLILRIR